jgi:enamine deaminase RidA (YjgF/YER057c/UK114 family)
VERQTVASDTEWEPVVGYARTVRVGPHVNVSGTTATDANGEVVGAGDAAAQTRQALCNIERALGEAGAQLDDVVRTRLYVTDIDDWQTVGRVHGEFFSAIRPATSMVEVRRLIDERMLVEIEAFAIVVGELS